MEYSKTSCSQVNSQAELSGSILIRIVVSIADCDQCGMSSASSVKQSCCFCRSFERVDARLSYGQFSVSGRLDEVGQCRLRSYSQENAVENTHDSRENQIELSNVLLIVVVNP
ncbi:hypothetical protein PHET_11661 [Paragonimus heterotremus]|uniref:Uncharacterized protein n=1 Tax=Paragonimus heterotremus TaxID=100268 RepID=A0A8J4T3I2_9TREM|nr:hypothetical protein PHET_11661 [Paragonimus heterotremus]